MIDWDREVLAATMAVFGEGEPSDPTTWPTYLPRGGAPFALADAVFDENYADATLDGEGTENATRKPCLGVRIQLFRNAGAADPATNDRVYIPRTGGTYMVKNSWPDGHGEVRLILQGPMA